MRRTGVRDSAGGVGFGGSALGERGTAAVAGHFDIATFVARCRVAIVNPEERADGHLLAGLDERRFAIRSDLHDFTGTEVTHVFVAEVVQGAAFLDGNHRAFLLAEDNRRAAPLVAACKELAIAVHEQHGAATLHLLVHVLEAIDNRVAGRDERGNDFGRTDHTARGRVLQLHAVVAEEFVLEFFDVRQEADGDNRERAELGRHHERLRVGVGDDADANLAREGCDVVFELAAERGILDVVDRTMEHSVRLENRHTATVGSKM